MAVPQKIKNRITIGTSNSTSWYISQGLKAESQRCLHTPAHSSGVHNNQEAGATQVSVDEQVHKQNAVDTYSVVLLGL